MEPIKNRYEFVVLFDVENGNPNGDPDAGNMPRVDPETAFGIVTDVCLKRKIRNYVEIAKEGDLGYNILIKNDKPLNERFSDAIKALELPTGKKDKANDEDLFKAKKYMCENYFDVRAFGAVMNTGDNWCGTVRGPVQLTFSKSISAVYPTELTITRQAVTKESEFYKDKKKTEMGKKSLLPYALYRVEGFVSAMLSQKVTGFSEEDLELLWTAIINMFEHDRSAARGKMCVRKLYVFKHESELGNAPAQVLFEKISVKKVGDVTVPRHFSDYEVNVDTQMPSGVTLIDKL